jgi:glycosyltransferase involved in cell wall biosynthesis
VQSLALAQARAGYTVHIGLLYHSHERNQAMLDALRAGGISVHPHELPARAYVREAKIIKEICARADPDVVHTHGHRPDVLHGLVARRSRLPVVSTVHGFTGGGYKNRIYEHIQRRSLRRHDAVIAVSRPLVAQLSASGISHERLYCIPNAILIDHPFVGRDAARRRLGVPGDGFVVGFLGRVSHEKGPDVFLDAITGVADGLTAVVIGEGKLKAALQQRYHDSSSGVSVRWAGGIEGAARFLRAFDAVVLSSRTEGTPLVLLEAMAAGVPVVSTKVGGIPDIVSDQEALLVPSDDPSAVRKAIVSIMIAPQEAAMRAQRAEERIRTHFASEPWQAQYDSVYRATSLSSESGRQSDVSQHARAK